jgi:filamentous hemagglutinin family protein
MNRIYRLVWSERLGAMVAVAENCAGHGKRSGGVVGSVVNGAVSGALLALGLSMSGMAGMAHAADGPAPAALPSGGKVVAGQAAISQSGARMDITQTSRRAAIDWQKFDIGAQAEVRFAQPDRQSVALNRVLGQDASAIHGKLQANGQVFLLNPNGVLFGPKAKVDVGGLVATSMRLSNENFMAGRHDFKRDGKGAVVNQGEIGASEGGYIALLAPEVRNEGILTARLGTVALAAGDAATLEIGAEGRLSVRLDPGTVNTLVENRHMIVAEGGNVILSAGAELRLREGAIAAKGAATALRINSDGSATLSAASAPTAGAADAAPTATVLQSGKVQAEGGRIDIHGRNG